MFFTENERKIIDFLQECPKEYKEIVKLLKGKVIKDRRTINSILRNLESHRTIFRVEVNGQVFYRLNIFPDKILCFFTLAEGMGDETLLRVKNDVLRFYPNKPFEKILRRYRDYLKSAKPDLKGIIQILKEYEGKMYNQPFG